MIAHVGVKFAHTHTDTHAKHFTLFTLCNDVREFPGNRVCGSSRVDMAASKKGYFESLDKNDQDLYRKKCSSIEDIDPYLITKNEMTSNPEFWPIISHGDIVHYLVFSTNLLCTMEEMRACKGLDSNNQFTSGFVRDVGVAMTNGKYIIRGRVSMFVIHLRSQNNMK